MTSPSPSPRATPADRIADSLATWFGSGYSPLAPGTAGTLAALPLYCLLRRAPWSVYAGGWCALLVVGTWASHRRARRLGREDPQEIVIDEVAGALLALGFVRGRGLGIETATLAVFRLLDIIKPGPIRAAERARPLGVGIMLDDLLGGLGAGLLLRWLS